MSWQSFSPDHGKLLIPAITRSCLLISPHMQWRLQDIKPCISMNIFTHSYISCNRSSALQLVLFLFFFPWCPQLLFFVLFPWTKSIAELHFHQCSWWLFELFTVRLWPGAGRIQCEARNVWTVTHWLLGRVYFWNEYMLLRLVVLKGGIPLRCLWWWCFRWRPGI